jgi:hypothetical protein
VDRHGRRRLKYNGNKRNRQAIYRDRRECGKIGVGSRSPQRTVGLEEEEEEEIIIIIIIIIKHMNMNIAAHRHLLFVSDSAIHIRSLSREKQIIANYARV